MTNEELAKLIKNLTKELTETRKELNQTRDKLEKVTSKQPIVPPWERAGFKTKEEWTKEIPQ